MAKKKPVIKPVDPWDNRWVVPTRKQLYADYKEHVLKVADHMTDGMLAIEGVEEDMRWFGVGWRWSFEYRMPALSQFADRENNYDDELDTLAYLVPYPEQFRIIVPLRLDIIESMPIRRLNRFVREGIKSSKWAVNIQWATFTPPGTNEADHLLDMLKRKHKYLHQTLVAETV